MKTFKQFLKEEGWHTGVPREHSRRREARGGYGYRPLDTDNARCHDCEATFTLHPKQDGPTEVMCPNCRATSDAASVREKY